MLKQIKVINALSKESDLTESVLNCARNTEEKDNNLFTLCNIVMDLKE